MKTVHVELRNKTMSPKQLRREGFIPCTVYGGQLEKDISIQMSRKEAEQLFRTKRVGGTVRLELGEDKIPALIKEKTHDSMGTQIEHIAFEALKGDVAVNSVAYIVLEHADQVPGLLEQMIHEVPFSSLPKDMIDTVTLDVKGMPVGTTVTLDDIPEFKNEAVTLKVAGDSVVYKIVDKTELPEEEAEETPAEA